MNAEQVERLIRFAEARVTDDERIARAATPAPWWYNPGKVWLGAEAFEMYDRSKGEEFVGYGESPFSGCVAATGPGNHPQSMRDAEHIARHDPARVLRDVASKRRILTEVVAQIDGMDRRIIGEWGSSTDEPDESHLLLKLLAAPYDSHPDWDEAWRP